MSRLTQPLLTTLVVVALFSSLEYLAVYPRHDGHARRLAATGPTTVVKATLRTETEMATMMTDNTEPAGDNGGMKESQEDEKDDLVDICNPEDKSESKSVVNYKYLALCTSLRNSAFAARFALIVILILLLYLLSSTADTFFSPVLQAIVEHYRIPPDIAGVTFLSFGNGSPDVFSNIAAFATSTPKIGVTSIIGGGLLVTTVVAASVGLASQGQEQLIPRKYIRDVLFYGIAIAYFALVFFDGVVSLPEALGFLGIYAIYVATVLLDGRISKFVYSLLGREYNENEPYGALTGIPSYSISLSPSVSEKSLSGVEEFQNPSFDVVHIPKYQATSGSDLPESEMLMPTLERNMSAPTPLSTGGTDSTQKRVSSLGEVEPLLYAQNPSDIPRSVSVCLPEVRRQRSVWEATEMSAHFHLNAKRWTRWYHQVQDVNDIGRPISIVEDEHEDSESEEDANAQVHIEGQAEMEDVKVAQSPLERYGLHWLRSAPSTFQQKVWSPLEFATTFIRRLTIPLVDEETWDKSFALVCPPIAILFVGVSVFKLDPFSNVSLVLAVIVGGGVGTAFVHWTASKQNPPEGFWLAPYLLLGFVMSVIWIMNIAKEVLAVLEVLGGLFGISNTILGVSVLACGNSIGDLVSNTSIARDGFPTMAFAGCFAGPMFNLLVGIGLALTFAIVSHGPMSMGTPSPLVYVGFTFLLLSVILNLGMAWFDGFTYRPRTCYMLIGLYFVFITTSVTVVVVNA